MVTTKGISYNLAGSVTSLGLPVNGTVIRLYDYRRGEDHSSKPFLGEQTTGPQGNFSFAVSRGLYFIEVIPGVNTRFARQSFSPIRVTSNTNFNVALKAGFILAGRVCDTAGNACPQCDILVFGIESCVIRTTQSVNENGRYSITLTAGKYYVAVQQRRENLAENQPLFLCADFQVVDLNRDMAWNFVMPVLAKFCGVVNDPDGYPVEGVSVRITALEIPLNVFARELNTTLECRTTDDGKFECSLLPGNYRLHFEAPADSDLAQKTISQLAILDDLSAKYTLDWGYMWSGRVLLKEKPLARALVTAFSAESDSECITDEDGHYLFSLLPGSYEYMVSMPANLSEKMPDIETAPLVGQMLLDKDTDEDLLLEAGLSVSGKVVDTAKNPRAGLHISLFPTRDGIFDGKGICSRPVASGLLGEDGGYEFRLMPGAYWLVFNNQVSGGYKIDISESCQTLVAEDICVVVFEVVSESEVPIPRCQVTFESYGLNRREIKAEERVLYPAITDEDGKCILTLSSGIYSLNFQPPENSSFESKYIRQLSIVVDMTRRVRLAVQEEK